LPVNQYDLQQVHHVCIINSLCHLRQQSVLLDVVKIATQVNVYDACLALNNRLGHPLNRFMRCLLGTIAKRARLEVRLEDRLQYELERTLHHPVPNRRNRQNADFASVLRYPFASGR
jgi:hypothetical protein